MRSPSPKLLELLRDTGNRGAEYRVAAFLLLQGYVPHFRMECPNMEQAMRNHYGLEFIEATRPEAVRNLTPTGRPKTYARHRKSEQAVSRLKDVQIDMARRQVAQIEVMIADLDRVGATLESEIEAEENRTGIRDPAHFAYSILAKATIVRRDNLKRTVTGLKDKLAVAHGRVAAFRRNQ